MVEKSLQRCTVCGLTCNSPILYRKTDDGGADGRIEIYRCGNGACNAVFLGNCPDTFQDNLYDYYQKYQGADKEQVFDLITRKRYLKLLARFASCVGGREVLDVGCGKGDFLDAALSAGWKASGIELSQSAVDVARGFGLPVKKVDLFSQEVVQSSADVVTMFEVIEHVANPGAFLHRLEEIVRPGGVVYLTTPNFNSVDRRILGSDWAPMHPEHVNYFTPSTLAKLIRRCCGLKIVSMETSNVSPELLRRVTGRLRPAKPVPETSAAVADGAVVSPPASLRAQIEGSPVLKSCKELANVVLNVSSLGSTIAALLRRPAR